MAIDREIDIYYRIWTGWKRNWEDSMMIISFLTAQVCALRLGVISMQTDA